MLRGYYFITDSALSKAGNLNDCRKAQASGVRLIQYRNKVLESRQMFDEALALRKICKKALFIVNDRVDIALGVKADGVHLGSEDLPFEAARKMLGRNKIIGLTVSNLKEAKAAEKKGADYIALSPIFATGTKADAGKPVGIAALEEVSENVSIPLAAIGGINLSNAKQVIEAGADMLCAISAVVGKADVKKEIRKFQGLFEKYSGQK